MWRIFFLVLALTYSVSFAQTKEVSAERKIPQAEKFDEFGLLGQCDLGARVDNLFINLMKNPSYKSYIIFYRNVDTLPAEYESIPAQIRYIRNYITLRRFDTSQVVFVDGDFRKEHKVEVWLVPNGAEAPKPTNTVPKPKISTDKTFLYDRSILGGDFYFEVLEEFILPSVKAQREEEQRIAEEEQRIAEEEYRKENPEVEETQTDETQIEKTENTQAQDTQEESVTSEEIPEEYKFNWINEKFGDLIKKRKDTYGVMIFYTDVLLYDLGKITNHIEEGKRKIADSAGISPDKIQVVFGGYRNEVEIEFFIVPKKGEIPTAKPEDRPIEEPIDEENNQ